jgi:hypothetical protein
MIGWSLVFIIINSHLFIEESTIENIESKQYEVIRTYTIEQGDTIDTRFKLKKIEP